MSKSPDQDSNSKPNTLLRFAGIGLQMGIIITAGALFGNYLDENQGNEKPIYAVVFSLIGVFIGLFLVIREALKIGKK